MRRRDLLAGAAAFAGGESCIVAAARTAEAARSATLVVTPERVEYGGVSGGFPRWRDLTLGECRAPEAARTPAVNGAELIAVRGAGAFGEMDEIMLRTRAYENGVWVAAAHPRRCLVIDPRGEIAAEDGGGATAATVRIVRDGRIGSGPIRNRRPQIYGELRRDAEPRTRAAEVTVAGLQMMPERWEKEANFRKLERFAREAAARGANVVVTPECFIDGYVGNDNANRPFATRERYFAVGESMEGPLIARVRALARELKVWLVAGFAERRGECMYNTAALFSPEGEPALRYSKTHTADDEPYNTKGAEFPVADTPLGRWGMLICMDRQLPETARILALKGAQLILVPAWGGYGETNDRMMRTRAYENRAAVAFVHPKRCLIIDAGGTVAAANSGEGEQAVMARVKVGTGAIRRRS